MSDIVLLILIPFYVSSVHGFCKIMSVSFLHFQEVEKPAVIALFKFSSKYRSDHSSHHDLIVGIQLSQLLFVFCLQTFL